MTLKHNYSAYFYVQMCIRKLVNLIEFGNLEDNFRFMMVHRADARQLAFNRKRFTLMKCDMTDEELYYE